GALGGGSGAWLGARALGVLPLGFSKLLISTFAGPLAGEATGGPDITVMASITDVAGLNPILRTVLTRAGRAIEAMSRPVVDGEGILSYPGALLAPTQNGVGEAAAGAAVETGRNVSYPGASLRPTQNR